VLPASSVAIAMMLAGVADNSMRQSTTSAVCGERRAALPLIVTEVIVPLL